MFLPYWFITRDNAGSDNTGFIVHFICPNASHFIKPATVGLNTHQPISLDKTGISIRALQILLGYDRFIPPKFYLNFN